ncbi:FAD-dependent oxidoreductase [Flavobacterium franklandianum]|uniref:FAD-dependent oxidoreductase n=1 Tax=Flavobacterium franklandianum TaxID=2594430 RepID=A0A553CJK8_9FLAO|nr:NAD(P)/FAD-dependent oxidoreductase [Flavobacterium franklandianum]TRX20679.1 FAD-dependent oxidoreductase [Flavobacterium franklandianum]TRX29327.1 FAD-dependent oxidoreductase [Flavobacterium franklandianum]
MKPTITIIGAGISGLSAAVNLHQKGYKIQILEATDRAGGRIKTDIIDGFRLDRGFQVILTEYPETKSLLDYKKLNLKRFLPGATVLYDKGQFEIADPFRRPTATFSTLFAPVGSLKDKINTLFLKNKLVKITFPELFKQPEIETIAQLEKYGFSPKMIDRFYKPFFSGIFLENDLKTSSNMFDFVMKMFSKGDAAIPELGMEEIPKQLVAMLPANSIQYNLKVSAIENNKVICEDGTTIDADKIIIATEAIGLASNYISKTKQKFHQVTNVYFEAKIAPTKKAVVVLNASTDKKWVNNLTVMSNVSNKYAPAGKVLISISYNGIPAIDDATLAENMKTELKKWYGNHVEDWKLLKTYRIKYALPNQEKVANEVPDSEIKINDNLFICGDHLLNGSINAAMKSGRVVAELIDDSFGV